MRNTGIAGLMLLAGVALWPQSAAADDEASLEIGGRTRTYLVHVPPRAERGRPMPLVVVLHGGGGDGAGAAKQTHFSDEADGRGFLVAYPDGTGRRRPLMSLFGKSGFFTWNAGGCCAYAMDHNVDDVAFIRAMVRQIERNYAVDTRRVYATGISNGAMMAYRLACDESRTFAAVGIVAGVVFEPCVPSEPVAVIDIHGTNDENVPVDGGVGDKALTKTAYPPLRESISLWARADRCRKQPIDTRPMRDVRLTSYAECRNGTEVSLYLIEGGGHSWPGGERMARFLDPPSQAMDATEVIWQFFAAHPKR